MKKFSVICFGAMVVVSSACGGGNKKSSGGNPPPDQTVSAAATLENLKKDFCSVTVGTAGAQSLDNPETILAPGSSFLLGQADSEILWVYMVGSDGKMYTERIMTADAEGGTCDFANAPRDSSFFIFFSDTAVFREKPRTGAPACTIPARTRVGAVSPYFFSCQWGECELQFGELAGLCSGLEKGYSGQKPESVYGKNS